MDDENSKQHIVKTFAHSHLRIEENKRESLKSFLEDCFNKIEKMEDFTNMKENISLIGQIIDNVSHKPKEEEDEEYFTLSQSINEINKPEPETEFKPEPDELLSALQQVIDHDKGDSISNNQCNHDTNVDAAVDTHFSENFHSNDSFSCVKVKEEPIDDPVSKDGFQGQKITEAVNIENHESFQTPKNTKTIKTGSKSTGRIRPRKFQLSSRKIEQSNRKITEFFPITSKSKNSIASNAPKSKLTDADNLFIVSAVHGDGNFCVLCQKKLTANYLKTHLINQHGVSKDIFKDGRKIKKEDTEHILKDKV